MKNKYLADVPEELKNAFLVRCPMCDLAYRAIKINVKIISGTRFVETLCPMHNGLVYTPMTDETKEALQRAGININSLNFQ